MSSRETIVSQRTASILSIVFGLATVTALGLAIYSIVRNEALAERNEQLVERNRELQERMDDQLDQYQRIIDAAEQAIARLEAARLRRTGVDATLVQGIAELQRNAALAREQRARLLRAQGPSPVTRRVL